MLRLCCSVSVRAQRHDAWLVSSARFHSGRQSEEGHGSLLQCLQLFFSLQDDAHIFCLPSQIEDEILGVLNLTEVVLSQFGFSHFEAS